MTFPAKIDKLNKFSVQEWRNGRRAGFRHQFPVSEGSSPFSCIHKTAGPWIESGPAVLFAALVGYHKKSPRSIARPWAFFYAREGTRTPKDKPHAPQTCASASSATLAYLLYSSPVFEVENRWCGLLAYSNTFPAIRQVVSLFLISFFKFHIYNSSAECAQRQLSGQFHRSFVRGKPACGAAPRAKEGVRV